MISAAPGMARRATQLNLDEAEVVNRGISEQRAWRIKILINPMYIGSLTLLNFIFSMILVFCDRATVTWKQIYFTPMLIAASIINLVFFLDLLANLVILGFKSVWKEKKFIYLEVFLQIAWLVLVIYMFKENDLSSDGCFTDIALIFLIRNARVFYFAQEIQSIRLVLETTKMISRPIMGKFLWIYLVFYIYTQIGCLLFGGKLTMETYVDSGAPQFYYTMNFNDFGAGMIVLFHQMVVNNWFVTVDMYTNIMGEASFMWVRAYFVLFWITIVLIQLNIIIAVVLEIFGSVADQVNDYMHHVQVSKKLKKELEGYSEKEIKERIEEARRFIIEEQNRLDELNENASNRSGSLKKTRTASVESSRGELRRGS